MNRTLYYRNLAVFIIFVAVIFATPYLFAQSVTSPTLIRIDGARTQLRSRDNPNQVNTTLTQGTIIQFPNAVIENMVYDSNGNVAMAETIRVWHSLAAEDQRLLPRQVNGRLVYPVKILASNDAGFNANSRDSVGYVALADFLRPGSFNTVRADEEVVTPTEPDNPAPAPILDNSGVADETTTPVVYEELPFLTNEAGGSETTVPEGSSLAPSTSLIPVPRPRPENPEVTAPVVNPPAIPSNIANAPSLTGGFECSGSWSRNYSTTNCFAQNGMTVKQKAEHIMGDIHALNSMRELSIDPRFSLCIANRESGMAPNASSGRGDWGLYQVRDSTGEEAIATHGMVTPGFEQYNTRGEYRALRDRFPSNPLAQADVHHSVVIGKASIADFLRGTNIRQRLGNGTMRVEDYQILADYYNASSNRRAYARAIANCYRAMLSVATEDGQVRSGQESALVSALTLATH